MNRMITRVRSRMARASGDEGFASLELVVITPFFIALLLLVVGFGRLTHGKQLVQQASAAAARAAALASTPSQAQADATTEANDTLSQAGISCQQMTASVDTSQFRAGGQVAVTVTCTTSLASLTVVGFPGHKTLMASSTAPLDQYRQYGSAAP